MQNIQIIFSLYKQYFQTSRPRFWRYTLGSYCIGLIVGSQFTELWGMNEILTFQAFWFFLYFSYPANLLIYGINDIFDYETDKLNPKKDGYEGLITPDKQRILRLLIAGINIPFLLLSILPNTGSYIWLFVFVIATVFYSAPPLRAKAKPILDTIVSAFVYIAPGFVGYYIIGGEQINRMIFFALLTRNMAMHAYSAIPDIEADSQAGISTVATLYGYNGTLRFCIICYLLSALFSLPSLGYFSIIAGLVYIAIMISSFTGNIFRIYKYFPWINGVIGFLLFWYLVLLKIGFL